MKLVTQIFIKSKSLEEKKKYNYLNLIAVLYHNRVPSAIFRLWWTIHLLCEPLSFDAMVYFIWCNYIGFILQAESNRSSSREIIWYNIIWVLRSPSVYGPLTWRIITQDRLITYSVAIRDNLKRIWGIIVWVQ